MWQSKTHSPETTYKQAHDGLRLNGDWIRKRPTVVLGDFNSNGSFRSPNWGQLLDLMKPLGLVSAYHHHFSEGYGEETRPTHYHRRKEDAAFHLDYCFVPEAWVEHIANVEVGSYDDWCKVSDHMPLIVDVDL